MLLLVCIVVTRKPSSVAGLKDERKLLNPFNSSSARYFIGVGIIAGSR
jgi:hypothetical protein